MPGNISAASMSLTIRGVEYHVAPLSDRDIDEVNNWLKSRLIATARGSLTPDMDQESRDEVLGAAVREASKIDFMAGRGIRELMGPNGICRLLYQSLRREHPGITVEAARSLIFATPGKPDKEVLDAFAGIFTELNMAKKEEKPHENGAPKGESQS